MSHGSGCPEGTLLLRRSQNPRLLGPPLPIPLQLDEFRYSVRLGAQGCGKGERDLELISFLPLYARMPITKLLVCKEENSKNN